MNILTFDIEEWYVEKTFHGGRTSRYQLFDKYLNDILYLLEEKQLKATFFCVGRMAEDFPEVVKKIARGGHEIGCHSNCHTWLNKMTYEEVDEDTRMAIGSLEQCTGEKVRSYRAPAFSIGENNSWAFEILSKYGIERDSSVFPATRDFGGFPMFKSHIPTVISYNGSTIKEFPIPTITLLGKEIAYSGGGYFRFFPLWFIKRALEQSNYNMTYFHIDDFTTSMSKVMSRKEYEDYFHENGSLLNRYKRYFKRNIGKKNSFSKLKLIIEDCPFCNISEADQLHNWDNAPKMVL